MGTKQVMNMGSPPRLAPTNAAGEETLLHITNGMYWAVPGTQHHGEFLLCGDAIDWSQTHGTADQATWCPTCQAMDC